jgi:hypothetical protein
VIIDVIGECGLDTVLDLEGVMHETKQSSVVHELIFIYFSAIFFLSCTTEEF